jgi:DNA-binding IclR family transcriptional regulator
MAATLAKDQFRRVGQQGQVSRIFGSRRKGLARAVEKPIPGVNAFSAPVFVALVITAIGSSHTFDADWASPIAEELRKCVANVSMRLGFSAKGSKEA